REATQRRRVVHGGAQVRRVGVVDGGALAVLDDRRDRGRSLREIGRASCRGRGLVVVVAAVGGQAGEGNGPESAVGGGVGQDDSCRHAHVLGRGRRRLCAVVGLVEAVGHLRCGVGALVGREATQRRRVVHGGAQVRRVGVVDGGALAVLDDRRDRGRSLR